MSSSKNILQVFEHHTLKVDEESTFKMVHFNALEKYGYKTKEKFFSVGNRRIKFNNYVGVIQVKNLTIEILPKADNNGELESSKEKWHNALITMLKECKLIKLNTISNAKLKLKSASILDLYYDLFLSETETIFKHGLRKNYRPIEENLNKVKGKILFTNHIRKNAFHKERFFVEHEIFDADNKLNQILLKALLVLKTIAHNPNHNIRINKLLLNFEDVSEESITEKWFEILTFDRNTERYRQAITLAKLIILRYSPDLKGGNENVLAIMFDMNMLYENYVYRKLKTLQNDSDNPIIKVKEQNRTPFWETRGLRADIIVETKDKRLVIDTKWKVLKDNKPSDADLKQMFVYNLHYDTDLSILLYPKTTLESSEKKPFRDEKFKALNCQVAFTDLFNDEGRLEKDLGMRIYNELLKEEIKTGVNNT
jgi:5-methylcytosine-specific restriction enzyme subunit McrC